MRFPVVSSLTKKHMFITQGDRPSHIFFLKLFLVWLFFVFILAQQMTTCLKSFCLVVFVLWKNCSKDRNVRQWTFINNLKQLFQKKVKVVGAVVYGLSNTSVLEFSAIVWSYDDLVRFDASNDHRTTSCDASIIHRTTSFHPFSTTLHETQTNMLMLLQYHQ